MTEMEGGEWGDDRERCGSGGRETERGEQDAIAAAQKKLNPTLGTLVQRYPELQLGTSLGTSICTEKCQSVAPF